MANFNFEIEGLDELEKDLTEALKEYPETMKGGLKDIAKEFKKSCMQKTPDGQNHKGDAKTKLRKKYGIKVLEEGFATTALVYNSARHYHLVENGHELVKNGKNIGWVPGKHMMRTTQAEFENALPDKLEKLVDTTLRGHNL